MDSGVLRGGLGVQPPPPFKFQRPSKIMLNSTWLWKLLKIAEFRAPTPQDVLKKCSKILKLPPVRNCFTLAMTNKLVVIINSLKVPKIKKILLYEMKFLVQNYNCLQNPWLGGYHPCPLSSTEFVEPPHPTPPKQNSWVCHCPWNVDLNSWREQTVSCVTRAEVVCVDANTVDRWGLCYSGVCQ